MNFFRSHILLGICFMLWASFSQAQFGTGMWGGMQTCPYEPVTGSGATSIEDDVNEQVDLIRNLQEELRDAKQDDKDFKKDLEYHKRKVKSVGIKDDFFGVLDTHITSGATCSATATTAQPYEPWQWNRICKYYECANNASSCSCPNGAENCSERNTDRFSHNSTVNVDIACRDDGNKGVNSSTVDKNVYKAGDCKTSLKSYIETVNKQKQNQAKIERLDAEIKNARAEIAKLKKDYSREIREQQREARRQMTEGGCVDCAIGGTGTVFRPRKPSGWEIFANSLTQIGLGALNVYGSYQTQKTVAEYNAQIGMPTNSYPSIMAGLPNIMAGLYGGIGGAVGAGGFGCMPGIGGYNNGANGMMGPFGNGSPYGPYGSPSVFGYPPGMYGTPVGGGIFMPGMGPWGQAGPWGLGGGVGGPWGGMPGGMPAMGYASTGFPATGYALGGAIGGAIGFPMNGGMYGGGPWGGGGLYGGGFPASGGLYGGGGMFGGPIGGAIGGVMGWPTNGGMSGWPASGGLAMGGFDSSAQMQWQLQQYQMQMQMQMQQYQMQMQYVKQQQENYIARQRVVQGLQQELYSLMARLQQAQAGILSGGSLGFDAGFNFGVGGNIGFGGGVNGNFNNNPIVSPVPGSR